MPSDGASFPCVSTTDVPADCCSVGGLGLGVVDGNVKITGGNVVGTLVFLETQDCKTKSME